MSTSKELRLAAIDRVAPKGWTGINWIRTSDTAIALSRERAGLPGKTRERVRQVREAIAGALKPVQIQMLRDVVEQCIAAGEIPVDKVRDLRRGVKELRPIDWHKPVTNPPSVQRILMLPRNEVASMTAAQVAAKVRCLEPWAAQVLRKNQVPFLDVAEQAGTKYPWQTVAPLEWFLLSDAEIGAKVECANVSVVAQYRERHGGVRKYGNPALTIVRRNLMHYPADFRFRAVQKHLAGQPQAMPLDKAEGLHGALTALVKLVEKAFPGVPHAEWFPRSAFDVKRQEQVKDPVQAEVPAVQAEVLKDSVDA